MKYKNKNKNKTLLFCYFLGLIRGICLNIGEGNLYLQDMTCHQVFSMSNTTGVTCGAGTAYHVEETKVSPGFELRFVLHNR